ncbi:hypothetical protein BDF20DRAFT_663815 [Mycotypha africana]|uniref:uncharacterized protein n=1 Tax=Mycotypha africana TaxID=64632 RepID=UPI002300844F|nr:uncharacterized protein BDF20DRAFT_663815 [Mycotypha africana]KAI8973644.1 hypothetical protein BDF20DRAFT_663815 [Mycotypha africana]
MTHRSYQNLHNRTNLLGGLDATASRTPSPSSYINSSSSGRGSPSVSTNKKNDDAIGIRMNDRDLEYLESQNDQDISGLSAKVKILKNITGKIGEEIRSGNSFIEQMNDHYMNTGSVLGKTMHQFKIMAEKQSGTVWWVLTLFVVAIIYFFYIWFFK